MPTFEEDALLQIAARGEIVERTGKFVRLRGDLGLCLAHWNAQNKT